MTNVLIRKVTIVILQLVKWKIALVLIFGKEHGPLRIVLSTYIVRQFLGKPWRIEMLL